MRDAAIIYKWLVENAATYGFFQLKKETWHWEYHAGKPPYPCYPGDTPIEGRRVAGHKKA